MRILAVEDDPDAMRFLTSVLKRDHDVVSCSNGLDAIEVLRSGCFDLVMTDLCMPPPDGFEVLQAAQGAAPPVPVIVVTAVDTARAAMRAMKLGACEFLVKPAAEEDVLKAVAKAGAACCAELAVDEEYGLVGRSPAMRRVRRLVPLLSRSREAVLILGETGTGKELLARALHEAGPRSRGPYVAHNMAATPAELAESLFFGHLRGAFTGATSDHAGLFERAHGGTLFLDEVDSFPFALQAKLLRVLESGCVQRVGSATERPVDVRIIASSAVPLDETLAGGSFRADLYYRLSQIEVLIPPLRDRLEDIPLLVRHFLEQPSPAERGGPRIARSALEALSSHTWPGNCRELRNAVLSAALLAGGDTIQPEHLPRALREPRRSESSTTPLASLKDVERAHILQTLECAKGNRSRAARILGMDRGTLGRKIRALGLDPKRR